MGERRDEPAVNQDVGQGERLPHARLRPGTQFFERVAAVERDVLATPLQLTEQQAQIFML